MRRRDLNHDIGIFVATSPRGQLSTRSVPTQGLLRRAMAGRTSGVIDLDPGKPSKGPIYSFWGVRRNADLDGWDLPDEDAIEDDFIEGVDDPDP